MLTEAGDHVLRHCLVLEVAWRRVNVRIRDFGSEAKSLSYGGRSEIDGRLSQFCFCS